MFLFPKNFDFFDYFDSFAKELENALEVLRDLKKTENNGDIKTCAEKMKKIENDADSIIHAIIYALNKTFITPIEREDIAILAGNLDDVIDEIERATNRLFVYQIKPVPQEIFQYTELIEKAIPEMVEAISEMKNPKRREHVLLRCKNINLIENQADEINRRNLGKLLNEEKDPFLAIKLKEIYETLESVTDRCEDVADSLETIIVKNF